MRDQYELLNVVSQVLWHCSVLGFALVLIWYIAAIVPGDPICTMQGERFGLTPHECALVNYGGIGLVKMLVLLFFFFPWVAIRWLLHRQMGVKQ